jgi:ParB-like chromosome segregation protein Spo0J
VFRLGEEHFVGDGHHRVSVAQALGMAAIDAEVIDLGPGSA